jgi:hypothetical protein
VWAPDAITGQPFSCAGVGAANVPSNQACVASEKTLSEPIRPGYSREMALPGILTMHSRLVTAVVLGVAIFAEKTTRIAVGAVAWAI